MKKRKKKRKKRKKNRKKREKKKKEKREKKMSKKKKKRSAEVRTKGGIFRRPTRKLIVLNVADDRTSSGPEGRDTR